ncbi:hypothetical protein KXV74_000905, partial [Aspergillus fumigatus]
SSPAPRPPAAAASTAPIRKTFTSAPAAPRPSRHARKNAATPAPTPLTQPTTWGPSAATRAPAASATRNCRGNSHCRATQTRSALPTPARPPPHASVREVGWRVPRSNSCSRRGCRPTRRTRRCTGSRLDLLLRMRRLQVMSLGTKGAGKGKDKDKCRASAIRTAARQERSIPTMHRWNCRCSEMTTRARRSPCRVRRIPGRNGGRWGSRGGNT